MRNTLIGSVLGFGWTAGGDILEKLLIFHTEYRLQANKITYKNISFSSSMREYVLRLSGEPNVCNLAMVCSCVRPHCNRILLMFSPN